MIAKLQAIFAEVGGDLVLVQGGEGRLSFTGLEEGNEFGGESKREG